MDKNLSLQKIILYLFLLISGCTNSGTSHSPGPEVSHDIASALKANQAAQSSDEWESSNFHPEKIFEKWTKDRTASSEVCKYLLEKDGSDLTLFEEQIKEEKYKDLLKDCKEELQKKIEKYWKHEREKMGVKDSGPENQDATRTAGEAELNFRFPDNVQKRDLSNGYSTITGEVAAKEVVLTFDDGPHATYTDQILKSLGEVNAKVIFFTISRSVNAYPEVLKRAAAEGHSIGAHSNSHRCLASNSRCQAMNGRRLSFQEATTEIAGSLSAVQKVLGWVDPFFRFPYGESDSNLKNYLRKNSIGEFFWAVDSNDWKQKTPLQVVNDTIAQIEARGHGIVLFHDIQRRTAEALPTFLKQLYYKGYSVVLLKPSNEHANFKTQILE